MNNYIKTFKLKNRKDINQFVFDFADFDKMNRNLPISVPHRLIDYVRTFKLINNDLINKFINEFCIHEWIDDTVKVAERVEWEAEVGIDIFRQEHDRSMLEIEEKRLKKQFDKRLN